jgi:GNAT superfamily N-acetyltransferase
VPAVIGEDVRRFAEDPAAWGEIRPETGLTRILTDRYCLLLGPVPSFTSVSRLRIDPDDVAEVIHEVRGHVSERGHREAMWWVGSSATPADLVDRLRTHGLVPDDRPGSEAHATSLVLDHEPPAVEGIEARRVRDFDEFTIANRIAAEAFGATPEDAAQWEAIAEQRWEADRAGDAPRTYIAYLDGRAVGAARAVLDAGDPAVLMIGGAVLPAARGRGVYRALVRARWDDAVEAGIPALCTHAGAMSRPILERLGFHAVAEQEVLLDPATC